MRELIKLDRNNIDLMTNIHSQSFPEFFLTALGPNFLSVFYKSLLRDKKTISWGIKENDILIGFFVATENSDGLYKKIFIKNFFQFLIPLLTAFFKNINLLFRLIKSFNSTKAHRVPIDYKASLLSICILPTFSGKGLGKLLISKLENELIQRNILKYYLTTDADSNESTNIFYQKNQFYLHLNFWQGKRKMNLYLKNIK